VYIAPSHIRGAGLGLFACREFRKGAVIGWYSGDIVWRSVVAGGPEVTDKFISRITHGAHPRKYDLRYRDRRGHMVHVSPRPFNDNLAPGQRTYGKCVFFILK
jgi:hypothetical protein